MESIKRLWYDYLWFVDKNTHAIIVFQYLMTVILSFVPKEILMDYYFLISNFLGYSILSNSFVSVKVWSNKVKSSAIVKCMILSLMVSNLFSMIALWTTREFYLNIFDRYFLVSLAVLIYLYYIKKNKIHKKI